MVSLDASAWRERVTASMVGEFVPVEQWCLPYPNTVSPIGVHCGGLPTALGHFRNYADAVKYMEEGDRVLNIGAGAGLESRLFFLVTGEEVVHTDKTREYIELSELVYPCPGVHRVLWDITKRPPFDLGVFDVIVCTEVLEHIEFSLWKHVKDNIALTLKPGGKFICSFPVNEDITSGSASSHHVTSISSVEFVAEYFGFENSASFIPIGDARPKNCLDSCLDWWINCFNEKDKKIIAKRLESYL